MVVGFVGLGVCKVRGFSVYMFALFGFVGHGFVVICSFETAVIGGKDDDV